MPLGDQFGVAARPTYAEQVSSRHIHMAGKMVYAHREQVPMEVYAIGHCHDEVRCIMNWPYWLHHSHDLSMRGEALLQKARK